jgi:uncharacterized protein YyaL (SSP411 family)
MYDASSGSLLRRFREGEAAIAGFLDDYAFFGQALLDLYETQYDPKDLQTAAALTAAMRERFEDRAGGAFYSTAEGQGDLVLRMKDDYDGAEPSGNSVAALNLLRLAQLTGNDECRAAAQRVFDAFATRMHGAPMGVPQMLASYAFSVDKPRQVVIAGDAADPGTQEMLGILHARFLPNKVSLLVNDRSREIVSTHNPVIREMRQIDGKATAYVCEDFACQLPTTEPGRFAELLG